MDNLIKFHFFILIFLFAINFVFRIEQEKTIFLQEDVVKNWSIEIWNFVMSKYFEKWFELRWKCWFNKSCFQVDEFHFAAICQEPPNQSSFKPVLNLFGRLIFHPCHYNSLFYTHCKKNLYLFYFFFQIFSLLEENNKLCCVILPEENWIFAKDCCSCWFWLNKHLQNCLEN